MYVLPAIQFESADFNLHALPDTPYFYRSRRGISRSGYYQLPSWYCLFWRQTSWPGISAVSSKPSRDGPSHTSPLRGCMHSFKNIIIQKERAILLNESNVLLRNTENSKWLNCRFFWTEEKITFLGIFLVRSYERIRLEQLLGLYFFILSRSRELCNSP